MSDKVPPSSPPPPITPGTPSFLAHSFFTSSYTSSLQLTAMPGPALSPTPIHTTTTLDTHFEPVSPEDGDRTPKLGPGEGKSAQHITAISYQHIVSRQICLQLFLLCQQFNLALLFLWWVE